MAQSSWSPWARIAALGFIFMILLGNGWMVLMLMGKPMPYWLGELFWGAASIVFVGGVGMGCSAIWEWLREM